MITFSKKGHQMFKKEPLCELCGEKTATAFALVEENSSHSHNHWKFCCECALNKNLYYIQFNRFFANPSATIDWLAHLNENTGMNWADFMAMIVCFRKATNSYGSE